MISLIEGRFYFTRFMLKFVLFIYLNVTRKKEIEEEEEEGHEF